MGAVNKLNGNGKWETPAPQLVHQFPPEETPVSNMIEIKQRAQDLVGGVRSGHAQEIGQ
jgi:hypothetical protein